MRFLFLACVLVSVATAEPLEAVLTAQPAGDAVVLRVEGVSAVPREVSDLEPLLHIEFTFVEAGTGRQVPIGMRRGRLVTDAVEGNPALIECAPLSVAGGFAGTYRADLVFDPNRQNVRLRARGLQPVQARAEASFGDPAAFREQARKALLEVEDDSATTRRLGRELEALWDRAIRSTSGDPAWDTGLARLRSRLEMLPPRNRRRPAHSILDFMPAARGALGEAQAALEAAAAACEAEMKKPAGERRKEIPLRELETLRATLATVEKAAARRDALPDAEAARKALEVLRAGPATLRAWYAAWRSGTPGHRPADWPAWRARFEEEIRAAALLAGHAAAPDRYMDLALAIRLLTAGVPPAQNRTPSLLSVCSSRILGDAVDLPDAALVEEIEREIAGRLDLVERSLAPKQE